MFSLNEVIKNGTWLRVDIEDKMPFELRPLSFSKVDLSKIKDIDTTLNIWLLKLEIKNISKQQINVATCGEYIHILDEDEYTFSPFNNHSLNYSSNFVRTSGLKKFHTPGCYFGWSAAGELNPKLTRSGALAYELPDFYEQLFLGVSSGEICAV